MTASIDFSSSYAGIYARRTFVGNVNQALADRMAATPGAVICARLPEDPPSVGQFHAALYDMDHVPKQRRADVIAQFLLCSSTCPRAVHGYDITEARNRQERQPDADSKKWLTGSDVR